MCHLLHPPGLKKVFSNKDKILLKENGMLSQQTQYPLLHCFGDIICSLFLKDFIYQEGSLLCF